MPSPTAEPIITPEPGITLEIPSPTPENVAVIPNPDAFTWRLVAEGFDRPTGLVNSGDGSGRLFVMEQAGLIQILKDGKKLPIPFLDLRERVSTQGSTTAGLLGLVFHPDYAQNGFFYVHYSLSTLSDVISRFKVSDDPDQADPNSELRLLELTYPIGEHRGGGLVFGPDGFLYLSIGDGGGGGYGDAAGNAQNPGTLLGSILRLDVDGGEPFAIPADNPFVPGGGSPEVWAYGLRNPWRFSFDSLTGDLYLPDVGENQREELNFMTAGTGSGANYGWNLFEGSLPFSGEPANELNLIEPVIEYDHSLGCSITGGFVYRGQALPEWRGVYLYGDYCLGNIWALLRIPDGSWENKLVFELQAYISSFGLDEAGEIYLTSINGKVFKLVRKE
jgi:glucose/arabinose dehydrogenase